MASPGIVQASRLTGGGQGAVAVIGVRGPGARDMVSGLVRPARGQELHRRPADGVLFGVWIDSGEEIVATSTADDAAEVHCHGGEASVAHILGSLRHQGVAIISQDEWLRSSLDDPLAVSAAGLLPQAASRRVARILLDQQRGALRCAIRELQAALEANEIERARRRLQRLLRWSRVGVRLTTPWKIALCGKPNVGKSTLTNRLLGFERSLVHDQPGVTRDLVSSMTSLDGWPAVIQDLAGVRQAADKLEREGVRRATAAMAEADILIAVVSAADHTSPDDAHRTALRFADAWKGDATPVVPVANKCDLAGWPASDDQAEGIPGPVCVNSLSGEGIPSLIAELVRLICDSPPEPGEAAPFTVEHVQCLTSAESCLNSHASQRALEVLRAGFPEDG